MGERHLRQARNSPSAWPRPNYSRWWSIAFQHMSGLGSSVCWWLRNAAHSCFGPRVFRGLIKWTMVPMWKQNPGLMTTWASLGIKWNQIWHVCPTEQIADIRSSILAIPGNWNFFLHLLISHAEGVAYFVKWLSRSVRTRSQGEKPPLALDGHQEGYAHVKPERLLWKDSWSTGGAPAGVALARVTPGTLLEWRFF